jgi:hypothetical protein
MAKKITPQAVNSLASWPVIGQIVLKAALLFVMLNAAFALLDPMPFVGRIGIYNWLVPGRERITYNNGSSRSHTVTTTNLAADLGTHAVAGPHPPDEFRVFVFGDSATWAVTQSHDQTVTAFLNDMNLTTTDGRPMRFYNLGYPESSASKTLLLLDAAMRYQPDLIVWNLTLSTFYPDKVYHYLVVENPAPMARLDAAYHLASFDPDSREVVRPDMWDRTIVGRREELATLLRLQAYGITWGITGVDNIVYPYEAPPDSIPADQEDPGPISPDDLTFEYLYAIVERAGEVPVVLINEPTFIASGENSDRWYNESYSRQQFDSFRQIMAKMAMREGWTYLDAWDVIPPPYFTRDEMHRNPEGEIRFATYLAPYFVEWASR